MNRLISTSILICVFFSLSCAADEEDAEFSIDFEKYQLENGLEVVLHVDRSDPVAAVALTFHVGSVREEEGRTGFAHLFEHLFFLDSENLGPGGLDRLMNRVGSSANGFTSRDQTNYFEVVPKDALEKAIWAESDKLGFFINTVTEEVVAKEKQIVKNEKRQRVDNQPYGHNDFVVDKVMFPEGHPHNWQVIGSLADLDAAALADVKAFHERWYGPNNATLAIAGDIDVKKTKTWIKKYFGEIPRRPTPETAPVPALGLTEPRRVFHEDNIARVPQLTLAWPSVPLYHPDSYPLELLAGLLTDGKTTPFYKEIVKEQKLAPSTEAFSFSQELAGQFLLQIRAFQDTDLTTLYQGVEAAFARFEAGGVPADELARVKAGYETGFYNSLASVLGKAFQLAQYNMLAGDPGFVTQDIAQILAVTDAEILRVYETYIKDKAYVASSFVPKGQANLTLEGSTRAEVVEEAIVPGEGNFEEFERGEVVKTPSAFDRSIEPGLGDEPRLTAPSVWTKTLKNDLAVLGIQDNEIPLVRFQLFIQGGLRAEDPDRVGVANLLAETMLQGTASRTPEELEIAIQLLGADLVVDAFRESFVLSGTTLAKNFAATMSLVEEIMMEPRWDAGEFELARERVLNQIQQRAANPDAIAADVFNRLLYGSSILANSALGTEASVGATRLEDLKAYYQSALAPNMAAFQVAGAVSRQDVLASLKGLAEHWATNDVSLGDVPASSKDAAGLYFVDVPGAQQSVVRIGYLALAQTDPEFYPAEVMNFRFGGGGFASDLTQILREGKGYTYTIRSGFLGSDLPGPFSLRTSVRSNVTLESLKLIREMMEAHGQRFDAEDLEATRSYLLKSNARAFETLGAKLGLLADMSAYGFPADYALQQEAIVRDMTVKRVANLASRLLNTENMVWLVVGDAETQMPRLKELGFGTPVLLDRSGNPVN